MTKAKNSKAEFVGPVMIQIEKPKRITRTPSKKIETPKQEEPKQVKPVITHVIQDYARPAAGRRLFAFTAAWLELTGLNDGAHVEKKKLVKIAGETAISYHTKKGNFSVEKDGLALTAKGHNFFGDRKSKNEYDPKIVEVYSEIMTSGQADGNEVKAASAIVKL